MQKSFESKVLSMTFMTKSYKSSRTRVATLGVFYIKVDVSEMNRIAKVKGRDREEKRLSYESQRWEEEDEEAKL